MSTVSGSDTSGGVYKTPGELYEITHKYAKDGKVHFKLKFVGIWDPSNPQGAKKGSPADKANELCKKVLSEKNAVILKFSGTTLSGVFDASHALDKSQKAVFLIEETGGVLEGEATASAAGTKGTTTVAIGVKPPPTPHVPKAGELYVIENDQTFDKGVRVFKLKRIGTWDPSRIIQSHLQVDKPYDAQLRTLWNDQKIVYFGNVAGKAVACIDPDNFTHAGQFRFDVEGHPIEPTHFVGGNPEIASNRLHEHLNPRAPAQTVKFEEGDLYEIVDQVKHQGETVVQIRLLGKYNLKDPALPFKLDPSIKLPPRSQRLGASAASDRTNESEYVERVWNTRRAILFKKVDGKPSGFVDEIFIHKKKEDTPVRFEINGVPIKNQDAFFVGNSERLREDPEQLNHPYDNFLTNLYPAKHVSARQSPILKPESGAAAAPGLKTQEHIPAQPAQPKDKSPKKGFAVPPMYRSGVAASTTVRPATASSSTGTGSGSSDRSTPTPDQPSMNVTVSVQQDSAAAGSVTHAPPPVASAAPVGAQAVRAEALRVNHSEPVMSLQHILLTPEDLPLGLKMNHPMFGPYNPLPPQS